LIRSLTPLRAATEALMASTARIDELKKKFDENPRRYFAPLANEFRKAGDIEQAIIICEEFLPQQPGHMSGHIVYGQALFEAGKLPESRAVFETALGLDPENLIALRHLGDIARDQGDHPAARGWYARVLDADPRNEEIQAVISGLDAVAVTAPMDVIPEPSSPFAPPPIPEPDAAAPASDAIHAPPELLDLESFGAPPPLPAEPSLDDTHPLGVPVIPAAPQYTPSSANTAIIEGFSAHSFEQQPETESLMPAASEMAHGLESTAFMPPDEPVESASDLDSSLESGVPSFTAPERPVASLEGLQGHTEDAHTEGASLEHLPPLDLDDGLVLPPQGDAIAPAAHAERETPASVSSIADDFAEFEVPGSEEAVVASAPEAPLEEETASSPAYESIPTELPPSVIAAEAELIDAGESPAPTPEAAPDLEMELDEEPAAPAPFVTETMAELYLAQGFRERAHEVYVQLSAASPSNERLRGLAASLAEPAPASAAPTVRDFFARLAARRPANRAAAIVPPAADDFAPIDPMSGAIEPPDEVPYSVAEAEEAESAEASAPGWHADPLPPTPGADEAFALAEIEQEPEPEPEPAEPQEPVAPALERSAKMRTPNGSIDALFGNRVPGTSEDSAAAALAQAFGGVTEGPLPTIGRPAHAASGELSLDSVFRDGPSRAPRPSQSFSFDQFFTGSSSGASDKTSGAPSRPSGELAMPGEPPAEKSPEDIEQFNSWLQGLKQR
jgi:hypothetical protein